ncbi:hypothetical protein MGYG_07652 [Nannizzia gypsea CBS 118893]|uniref:PQ loop repeat protein n=1 Tax=Arthroderma gypseum (strain ATCC MYA-4604 / CBS 118893) TaxID=535722 RepID=E4V3S3_ARTGP|nr:hypothetical protein MGYG_07652 [Nannizzia gypsea CBS 118893]EFR04647.1 hypothetical protein MGYG_07652 [Nannizzia gypsea CBS 118893]
MDRMGLFRSELRATLFEPSPLSFVLNFLLLLAIPLPYFLQYIHIKKRQSIYGISFSFLVIRAIGTTENAANVFLLGPVFSIRTFCWVEYSGDQCADALLLYGHYILDWICAQAMFFLCLHYFQDLAIHEPLPQPATIRSADASLSDEQGEPLRQSPSLTAKRVAIRGVIFSYLVILVPYLLLISIPKSPPWEEPAYFTSVALWWFSVITFAGIFTLIAFLPQIYHTWTLKRAGSLSLPSLAFQGIIYLLWGIYLFVRFHVDVSWESFWIVYVFATNIWVNCLITGAGELVLLMLVIHYTYTTRDDNYLPAERSEPENPVDPGAAEQTPLLPQQPEHIK